jgi:hypothetical protein
MKIVVNEPQADYKIMGWKPEPKVIVFNDFICNIENETIFYCPSSGTTSFVFYEKPIKRISSLRGKMTKQDEKEIDDQLSEFRNEWERDI